MPLRTAPLPRMAGDLTFMRSRRATLPELGPGILAVLGAPIERASGPRTGCRFGPLSIRQTSAYFGWHANPQFSHPVSIDERTVVDTSAMHGRLVDLGDIRLDGCPGEAADLAICTTARAISTTGATLLLLGGDASIVAPAVRGACIDHGDAFCQIGGSLSENGGGCESGLVALLSDGTIAGRHVEIIAPRMGPTVEIGEWLRSAGAVLTGSRAAQLRRQDDWQLMAERLASSRRPLHVHLDISGFFGPLHGMNAMPHLGGLSLMSIRHCLAVLGTMQVASMIVTGLEPTANGLNAVKTGQRLVVTALLAFIYAQLIDRPLVPGSDINDC